MDVDSNFSSNPSMSKVIESFGDGSSFQDTILSRMNKALSIFKLMNGNESDQIRKMIPIFATALSMVM